MGSRILVKTDRTRVGQADRERCAECGKFRPALYEVPCPIGVINASCLHTPVCASCRDLPLSV
jgi:hypothetical protein